MTCPVTDPFGVTADPTMRFLSSAICPATAARNLALACPDLAGNPSRLCAIRVTRHKLGRRCLIEYDLESPDSATGVVTLVGKARAKGVDRAAFQLAQTLRRAGFGDDAADGVSVPEPVGTIGAFGMWLQRKVPGVTATGLLAGVGGVVLARRIAEGLHKLHRANLPANRRHTTTDELGILERLLTDLSRDRPKWAQRLYHLLDACRRLAVATPDFERRSIHRDFYPDQVLVNGSRLYLLDFDLYCEGDPALDAGNFLGHLTEQSLRSTGKPDALADREKAFEDRFVELTGQRSRAALRAYGLLTLTRHVALSTRFPERRPWTERLVDLCEERLAAAVPNSGYGGGPEMSLSLPVATPPCRHTATGG